MAIVDAVIHRSRPIGLIYMCIGLGGGEPTYDSLSLAEFVAGYLSIMEEVTPVCTDNALLLNHLIYLRQLMEDCFMSEWHMVRMAHKHVLIGIEHQRFRWSDAEVVMDVKRTALARIQNSSLATPSAPTIPQPLPSTSTRWPGSQEVRGSIPGCATKFVRCKNLAFNIGECVSRGSDTT